jgi:hypothetical protein
MVKVLIALGLAACVALAQDEVGFVSLFDGKTLEGWDGDPVYWKVENGTIVGTITPETVVKRNTFLIWRGGEPADFELKLEYRVSAQGNSGVNYRSLELTDAKWSLSGYQADIEGRERHTAQNYEERGRTFLALRGQVVRCVEGQRPQVIGSVGDAKELQALVKPFDWNAYHLIARGNVLTHILNGRVMSVVIDEDAAKRRMAGKIGVQVHVGPPMTIEYRNIRLKKLEPVR